MNSKNVVIGNYYRKKNTHMGWAKVLTILPPHKGLNRHDYWIAECEWTVDKGDLFGLIKYFRLSDLKTPVPNILPH